MKITTFYFILFLFCISLSSCADQKENEPEDYIEPVDVEFDNLDVGDVILYTYVTGQGHDTQSSEATYTGDTLKLTVLEEDNGEYIIQEEITPNSAIYDSETKYISKYENKYEAFWEITEDSISISSRTPMEDFESHLFPKPKSFSFAKFTEYEADFEGCRTTVPYDDFHVSFFIENGTLHDILYPHLNGIMNYIPFILDGDGSTHIYNKESGFVRVTSTSAWTARVWGWDKIKINQ